MAKGENGVGGYGKILARTFLVIVGMLLTWTVLTVHQLTIDVAVMQNQLHQIWAHQNVGP